MYTIIIIKTFLLFFLQQIRMNGKNINFNNNKNPKKLNLKKLKKYLI